MMAVAGVELETLVSEPDALTTLATFYVFYGIFQKVLLEVKRLYMLQNSIKRESCSEICFLGALRSLLISFF